MSEVPPQGPLHAAAERPQHPGRGALLVGAANAVGRVTGMLRDVVMAAVFGAGEVSDAYNAALRVPQLLRELLAEGSLQNIVVPAFAQTSEKEGAEAAWRLANAFLGVLLLTLGVVTAGFFVGADLWVRLIANGFTDDPPKFALTVTLTRWMAPFLAGLSLAALFSGLLNVRGRFFLPALAQSALNVTVIAACMTTSWWEGATGLPGIVGVALATTLSGFLQVSIVLPALWREGFRFRPTLRGHPALWKSLGFLGPAIIGIATVQFNLLVESQWASTWGDGVVTYLFGSFRLVQLPLTLVASSVVTAALPALAMQAARGDDEAFGQILARALRQTAYLVIPSAVALFVLAEPLVALFYERGAFTRADTLGTAAMLRMYALATFGICFHRIIVPVYYTIGSPRRPMWLSIGAMAAKIPVVLVLIRGFGMGAEALPLSHAITVSGECAALAWGLRFRLSGRGLVTAHVRFIGSATVLGIIAFLLRDRVPVPLTCLLAGLPYLALAGRPGRA